MTDHVVWLDDPACNRVEVSGGKGASLARLRAAGIPVPPGFVIAAETMSDSLEKQGVRERVAGLATSFGAEEEGSSIVAELQSILTGVAPSEELAEEIAVAYSTLGENAFVAVRSSACAEDGEAASFAGQQETFLNVLGSTAVLEKVSDCWASFFSERALFYRHRKGSLSDMGMAVVVQRQLASDKSGVLFTMDPIRRRSDQMVVEAAYGLGEAVVSGMVTPDNYLARRDGRIKKARVGRQDRMVTSEPGGGTTIVDVDEEQAVSRVLDDEEIARLVEVGGQLEEAFGAPQDIEWAFEGDELYVLQSRPITA